VLSPIGSPSSHRYYFFQNSLFLVLVQVGRVPLRQTRPSVPADQEETMNHACVFELKK